MFRKGQDSHALTMVLHEIVRQVRAAPTERVKPAVCLTGMLARILEGTKIYSRRRPPQGDHGEALAANKRIWIDLERQSPDADALLAEVLKLHPLTIEDIWGRALAARRSTTSTSTST